MSSIEFYILVATLVVRPSIPPSTQHMSWLLILQQCGFTIGLNVQSHPESRLFQSINFYSCHDIIFFNRKQQLWSKQIPLYRSVGLFLRFAICCSAFEYPTTNVNENSNSKNGIFFILYEIIFDYCNFSLLRRLIQASHNTIEHHQRLIIKPHVVDSNEVDLYVSRYSSYSDSVLHVFIYNTYPSTCYQYETCN